MNEHDNKPEREDIDLIKITDDSEKAELEDIDDSLSDEKSEEFSEDVEAISVEESAEDVSDESIEEVSYEDASGEVADDASGEVADDVSGEVADDGMEEVAEDASGEVAEDGTEEATEDVLDEANEDIKDKESEYVKLSNEGDSEIPDYSDERMTLYTRNLVKTYGKRTVVNNVSIHVRQGEIVGLLGPNGAGKTTSFYMTTGLVVPNGGKVFLNDEEITKYPVAKRAKAGIGYLAQEASVFRTMSVEDNIMSVLEMRKELSRKERREKMEELLNEFRLQKVRKNNGNQLSGGERRRCEIARCLAIDPKFIMLDEPFAGVDPIAVEDIQYIVWKLKDRNIGILITDHNVQETLCITDRAYLLFEGRILFKGTPPELSANQIVRDKYLGSNFVLRPKDFQLIEEKKNRESQEE